LYVCTPAEIRDLERAVGGIEEVAWLDVAVQDGKNVNLGETCQQLRHKSHGLVLGDAHAWQRAGIIKEARATHFQAQEHIPGFLGRIEEANNMGTASGV
jgi:hypothetical protein